MGYLIKVSNKYSCIVTYPTSNNPSLHSCILHQPTSGQPHFSETFRQGDFRQVRGTRVGGMGKVSDEKNKFLGGNFRLLKVGFLQILPWDSSAFCTTTTTTNLGRICFDSLFPAIINYLTSNSMRSKLDSIFGSQKISSLLLPSLKLTFSPLENEFPLGSDEQVARDDVMVFSDPKWGAIWNTSRSNPQNHAVKMPSFLAVKNRFSIRPIHQLTAGLDTSSQFTWPRASKAVGLSLSCASRTTVKMETAVVVMLLDGVVFKLRSKQQKIKIKSICSLHMKKFNHHLQGSYPIRVGARFLSMNSSKRNLWVRLQSGWWNFPWKNIVQKAEKIPRGRSNQHCL